MQTICRRVLGAGLALAAVMSCGAQPIDVQISTPILDRWVYTFGQNPGAETEATVFSILGSGFESTFDIRDGQFLVGYDTSGAVMPGQGTSRYRILSASVTTRISRDKVFRYDGTFDAMETYLPETDAAYIADADAGRPVELYAVGYRNGLNAVSFAENTPFAFGNPVQKRVRNAFAAQYESANGTGSLVDVSNNSYEQDGFPRFEARPFAIGTCPLAAGVEVDVNTDFTFAIDVTQAGAVRYLRESLNSGRLNLMLSSMAPTSQQSSVTPAFYTKEYPSTIGGVPARLSLRVCVGAPADWNCSGGVTVQDLFDFLSGYFVSQGDYNADGQTSVQDIFDFLTGYFGA
ncbi:MAG: hypothetical protein IT438_00305 [Phycisphaerales bacterium]|nr:hypothetical protein [Phycisphaerales bacterium]